MILLSSFGLITLSGNWRWNSQQRSFRFRAACSYSLCWSVIYSISSFFAVHRVTRSDGWIVYGFSLGGCKLTRFYFSTFLKCYLNMSLSCCSGILRSLAINLIVRIGRSNSSFFYSKVSLPYLRNRAFLSRNCLSCFEANFIRNLKLMKYTFQIHILY